LRYAGRQEPSCEADENELDDEDDTDEDVETDDDVELANAPSVLLTVCAWPPPPPTEDVEWVVVPVIRLDGLLPDEFDVPVKTG
jgi:hypothetical protein